MRAATPSGPGPTCRLCWMYLFGLTYANGAGFLVSSDFKRSTTCCLRLGGMAPPRTSSFPDIVDHSVLYVQALSEWSIMLPWDDENYSLERMSSIKQSQSSGSMASLRRVFRTLNRPQVCANLACTPNSRIKKTCSWRACADISMS